MSKAFRPDSDLTRELLAIFAGEARDELDAISTALGALEADADGAISAGRVEEMMRAAHSLKGGARAVELEPVDRIAHALETLLTGAAERRDFGGETADLSYRAIDAIDAIVAAASGGPAADVNVAALCEELAAEQDDDGDEPDQKPVADEPKPADPEPAEQATGASGRPAASQDATVRVSVAKLDSLIGAVRELESARVGIEHAAEQLTAVAEAADLEAREYDARAGAIRDATEQPLARLQRATRELSEDISRARTVPLSLAFDPLARVVRDLARDLGREVQLEISGGSIDVDRAVLEVIRPALVHLIRNAVDHGIEAPATRAAAGKPEQGTITVSARARGSQLTIEMADDGSGIDGERVKSRARELGLLDERAAASIEYEELIRFVLKPAFSTRETVSEISGRGVGLDAVFEGLAAFQGSVDISSSLGVGTTITLRSPLAIAAIDCLVAELGDDPIGIVLSDAVRIVSLEGQPDDATAIELDGRRVPLVSPDVTAELAPAGHERARFAIALEQDARLVALPVNEIRSVLRLGTMPLPKPLPATDLIRSAAILPGGEVLRMVDARAMIATLPPAARVLIAEDSATQRERARRALTRAGYIVEVAEDGRTALEALTDSEFDALLSDYEMPEMNGLELIAAVRGSEQLAGLSIVLWSASDDASLAFQASDAGADAFLEKGDDAEPAMLESLQRLLSERQARESHRGAQ